MKPVVPTTAWIPARRAHGQVARAASTRVKSTTTSAPEPVSAAEVPDTARPATSAPSSVARSVPPRARVDGGGQLEVGLGQHRPADLPAHLPPGPDHPDSHAGHPTVARPAALPD